MKLITGSKKKMCQLNSFSSPIKNNNKLYCSAAAQTSTGRIEMYLINYYPRDFPNIQELIF